VESLSFLTNQPCSTVHLDAVGVGTGQVGLDMVAAIIAAVDVHRHAKRGTLPLAAMEKNLSIRSL
jgi:hypothetical protein